MTKKNIAEKLRELGASSPAVEWAAKHRSLQRAWDECQDGSWMLWLLGRLAGQPDSPSCRKLVGTAAKCAELALPCVDDEETEGICRACVQTCVAYAEGEATLEDVRAVASAAYAAHAARTEVLAACADIVRGDYPDASRLP
jgi:hypothetical protein